MYLFVVTCVCLLPRICCNSHGCGVRSRRDFAFFLPVSLQLELVCVCVCVCVGQVGGRVWCSCIIIHPPFPLLLEPVWGPCGGEMARERRAREGLGGGWSGGETSAEWMALFAWPCLCCGPLSFSCSLARTQHTASVLSAPLSPYSNKCLHCSLRLHLAAQPFYSSSSRLFYILRALLLPSQGVLFNTALICRERAQIFVF